LADTGSFEEEKKLDRQPGGKKVCVPSRWEKGDAATHTRHTWWEGWSLEPLPLVEGVPLLFTLPSLQNCNAIGGQEQQPTLVLQRGHCPTAAPPSGLSAGALLQQSGHLHDTGFCLFARTDACGVYSRHTTLVKSFLCRTRWWRWVSSDKLNVRKSIYKCSLSSAL